MGNEIKEPNRTCFTCKNDAICFLSRNMNKVINEGKSILNFTTDFNSAPGNAAGIVMMVARSCFLYEAVEDLAKEGN